MDRAISAKVLARMEKERQIFKMNREDINGYITSIRYYNIVVNVAVE